MERKMEISAIPRRRVLIFFGFLLVALLGYIHLAGSSPKPPPNSTGDSANEEESFLTSLKSKVGSMLSSLAPKSLTPNSNVSFAVGTISPY